MMKESPMIRYSRKLKTMHEGSTQYIDQQNRIKAYGRTGSIAQSERKKK